jgi:hypothetical protein
MSDAQTPAGWYADPSDSSQQRYWDGSQWTDQRQPMPPAPAPGTTAVAAPPAPPPEKKKRRTRGCLTVMAALVVIGILILIIAAIAGGGSSNNNSGSSKSDSGKKTQLQEVTITKCGPPDAIGVVYVEGIADNTSSKRSDYLIDVTVTAPDGTQIGTGSTIAQNVEPGQKAVWKALTDTSRDKWVAKSTCKVANVERNASV